MRRPAHRNSPLTPPSYPSRRHRTARGHPESRKTETRIRASLQHGPLLFALDEMATPVGGHAKLRARNATR